MSLCTLLLLAAVVSFSTAWPLQKNFSNCRHYCSIQNTNNSACVKDCQTMNTPTFDCVFMCEKTYNTASDVDACTSGCNATLSSDLSISLELVSILTLMDTLANQAYHILLPLSFTNSEITVITVFTSEQEFSQWEALQDVDAANDQASLPANAHSSCSREHMSLFTHLAIGFLLVLIVVLVTSCYTATKEEAPATKLVPIKTVPLVLPSKTTPLVLPMSLNTSDKLLKGTIITL